MWLWVLNVVSHRFFLTTVPALLPLPSWTEQLHSSTSLSGCFWLEANWSQSEAVIQLNHAPDGLQVLHVLPQPLENWLVQKHYLLSIQAHCFSEVMSADFSLATMKFASFTKTKLLQPELISFRKTQGHILILVNLAVWPRKLLCLDYFFFVFIFIMRIKCTT